MGRRSARVVGAWLVAALVSTLPGIGHAADAARAQNISLSGSMGQRALLVIDGVPHTLAPGASIQGIKLIGLGEGEAQIEVDGQRRVLHLGVPVNLSAAQRPGAGTQIVMTAGAGGHFTVSGSINGAVVEFLVDTGATLVSISQTDADRIGLKYRDAPSGLSQTANGSVMIHYVRLDKLRIGDVEVYDVPATVVPAAMSFVLLGNSYLSRFQMKRENDKMTLDKRQ